MHGRLKVKTSKEQEEEQKIKKREQAYHFRNLTEKLFQLRPNLNENDNLDEFFKLSSEILLINSDFYTVWNIRREALMAQVDRIKQHQPQDDPEEKSNEAENEGANDNDVEKEILKIWKCELSFTFDCLRKNEKSYSVWQHRIWVLSKMPKSEYEMEIKICNNFLVKDERNFHCWDYRSFISDLADRDIEKEFEFTTEKIRSNFSNFSAWHRRHKLLIKASTLGENCPKGCNLKLIWNDEYNMILNALYTDPTDQSPWLYHNWLVKNSDGRFTSEQMRKLIELQELEPDNKCVKQAIELSNRYIKS